LIFQNSVERGDDMASPSAGRFIFDPARWIAQKRMSNYSTVGFYCLSVSRLKLIRTEINNAEISFGHLI